jgi:predicted dehydrogenase
MAPPPTYGVLLVSFSRHSHQRNFVPLYQAHERTRIVAIADEDDDVDEPLRRENRLRAEELGVPYLPSVVSIGHEIERRADLAVRAAAAGKHLWIDKFLGATIGDCDRVVAAVEAAGIGAIVPSYHYGSLVRHCLEALSAGSIGQLVGVHVDVMFAKGWPRPIEDHDRRPFLPAGRWKFPEVKRELLTVGAYAVGLVQACFGDIASGQVVAHGGAYFFPEHARTGTDDFGTLTLSIGDGRVASLCGGRIGVATHPAGGPSRAVLVGTHGTLTVDAKRPAAQAHLRETIVGTDYRPDAQDPMQWASGPPTLSPPLSPDAAGLAAGLEELVQALDEGRPPSYSVAEARQNMEILLAGYGSIVAGGLPVELPLSREAD